MSSDWKPSPEQLVSAYQFTTDLLLTQILAQLFSAMPPDYAEKLVERVYSMQENFPVDKTQDVEKERVRLLALMMWRTKVQLVEDAASMARQARAAASSGSQD